MYSLSGSHLFSLHTLPPHLLNQLGNCRFGPSTTKAVLFELWIFQSTRRGQPRSLYLKDKQRQLMREVGGLAGVRSGGFSDSLEEMAWFYANWIQCTASSQPRVWHTALAHWMATESRLCPGPSSQNILTACWKPMPTLLRGEQF